MSTIDDPVDAKNAVLLRGSHFGKMLVRIRPDAD